MPTSTLRAYRAVIPPSYNSPMPAAEEETRMAAGISPADAVDVAALFERLKEEVRRAGPASDGTGRRRLAARAQPERMWPVSAERPLKRRPGLRGIVLQPVKLVLRR